MALSLSELRELVMDREAWLIPLQISDNLGILYEVREKSMVEGLKADWG